MDSRRWQIVFLALVAALIVGREIFGAPQAMSLGDVWRALAR